MHATGPIQNASFDLWTIYTANMKDVRVNGIMVQVVIIQPDVVTTLEAQASIDSLKVGRNY